MGINCGGCSFPRLFAVIQTMYKRRVNTHYNNQVTYRCVRLYYIYSSYTQRRIAKNNEPNLYYNRLLVRTKRFKYHYV